MKYKRVLLKLTGEIFGDTNHKGLDLRSVNQVADDISSIHNISDMQLAIVVGAGNLFRGRQANNTNVDRATADYIGMIATFMNGLALQEALERMGKPTRVMSSLQVQSVCEPFIRRRAIRHLEEGKMVILVGGVGSPFFTTDSAAALRACELKCDVILKASNVDGIYNKDPNKYKNAKLIRKISYQVALEKNYLVMDNTAFALCQREEMPIRIFNLIPKSNLNDILNGAEIGSLVI